MARNDALFVLEELAKFAAGYSGRAVEVARRFTEDFTAKHPELIRPGDTEAPPAPAPDAIDVEVDGLIDRGEV